ncbi:MAG TPA: hypothetical protein VIY48_03985 [Candidatus Paceibacterota bacterium]
MSDIDMRTHQAAQELGLKTKESCAQFLSDAVNEDDWLLRVRYIASWSDNSPELWDYVKRESWVRATALIIGYGVSIELIDQEVVEGVLV